MVLLVSNIAGCLPILVFLATGDHGFTGIGIQEEGMNKGTGPAIFQFIGLIGDLHCPKAGMLINGIMSMLFASGLKVAVKVLLIGSTNMSLGPAPNEHFNFAPLHTHFGIN
tara:strand:+ start:387 stop:719 length:333 start_codon:yes stop_codon:yes gene_type:complete